MESGVKRTQRDYTLAFKPAVVEQAEKGKLAKQISIHLDLAIAAKAYTDALDSENGIEAVRSSVCNETLALLQKFISGNAQLSKSSQ